MIDTFTVGALWAATSASVVVVLLVLWFCDQASKSYLWWCAGFACVGAGITLLACQGKIPDVPSIEEIANAVLLVGIGLWHGGVRAFDNRPARPWILAPALLWMLIVLVLVPEVRDNDAMKIALFNLCSAMGMSLIARDLWGSPQDSGYSRSFIAILCLGEAGVSLLWACEIFNDHFTNKPFDNDRYNEIVIFQSFVSLIIVVMFGSMMTMERRVQRLSRLAMSDPLTLLLNRRGFRELSEMAMKRSARTRESVALVLFDLDNFKSINDRFGHAAGDKVLIEFAERSQTCLRREDILGRLGGEEFVLLLPGVDEEGAEAVGERIRLALRNKPITFNRTLIRATVSAGVAVMPAESMNLEALITTADTALYAAKGAGRDRVCRSSQPEEEVIEEGLVGSHLGSLISHRA